MFTNDETPALLQLFNDDSAPYRLMIALLQNPREKFNKTSLAREADVDPSTVHRNGDLLDFLFEIGFLRVVESDGNTDWFRVNRDTMLAKAGIQWVAEMEKARQRYEEDVEDVSDEFFE